MTGRRPSPRQAPGAGAFRRAVTLLARVSAPDGAGGAQIAYVPDTDVWAIVERLSSVRDIAGDRSVRLRRLSVTIRFRDGIALGDRLRFEAVDYDITSLEDADDRGARLTLICEEAA